MTATIVWMDGWLTDAAMMRSQTGYLQDGFIAVLRPGSCRPLSSGRVL